MKRIIALLTLPALLLIGGCATTDEVVLDTTKRVPTQTVDIFKDAQKCTGSA
jgi:hypothetical protein